MLPRLVEEIHTDHGGVDVLVNNAGCGLSSPLEQVALRDLRSIFETNVVAMLHPCQAVLPSMRARRRRHRQHRQHRGRFPTLGVAYHISK
jgi:NADP-dependent 3-hydroxy acid dehydrogenase YdfG